MLFQYFGDSFELLKAKDFTNWVVRVIDNENLGLRIESLLKGYEVNLPLILGRRNYRPFNLLQ